MKSYTSFTQPRNLSEQDQLKLNDYLWSNFCDAIHANREGITNTLIQDALKLMISNQGADFSQAPQGLLTYMSPEDILKATTDLFVYIKLSPALTEAIKNNSVYEYLVAFDPTKHRINRETRDQARSLRLTLVQSNPYVLRFHVLALHNLMHHLTAVNPSPNDPEWEKQRNAVYAATLICQKQIQPLMEKYPAFAHFVSAYNHYTQAMGATTENTQKHWEKAYEHLLAVEATEKQHPKASFIVNLGHDVYKDMPFDNLEEIKAQIEEKLPQDKVRELRMEVERTMRAGTK